MQGGVGGELLNRYPGLSPTYASAALRCLSPLPYNCTEFFVVAGGTDVEAHYSPRYRTSSHAH